MPCSLTDGLKLFEMETLLSVRMRAKQTADGQISPQVFA